MTIKRAKRPIKSPTTANTKDLLKAPHTTSLTSLTDNHDCPFYIIRNEDSLHNVRFELIYKKNLMCVSAQGTLEKTLSSITKMTDRAGHSLMGLINYIDNAVILSEHNFKPCPAVYVSRKEHFNDEYTNDIMRAIRASENALNVKIPLSKNHNGSGKILRAKKS